MFGCSAGIVERGIGTNTVGPGAPDIVVHDGDVVEDFCECRDVGGCIAICIGPGCNASSSSENEFSADGVTTEFLEEGKEVGCIIGRDDVTSNALINGGFPAKGRNIRQKVEINNLAVWRLTYSKSTASSLLSLARSVTVLTNAVRFSGLPTFVEKKREPVQPPIDTLALTP